MDAKIRHLRERTLRLEIVLEKIIDIYGDRDWPNGPICKPEGQTDENIGRAIEIMGIGYFRPGKTEVSA